MDSGQRKGGRSTLAKADAKRRYVEVGVAAALDQIHSEAQGLDAELFAIGPFARLDAGAVAARDGKTRGSVTNLFGSQAVFQAETMALALGANELVRDLAYPDPADFADADTWVDALFAAQSARGPRHGADPTNDYSFLWALWLSAVPYGLWSQQIAAPSLDEHRQWVDRLEKLLGDAVGHFGLTFRPGATATDLACAMASMVEGVWLNQCLTTRHPRDASEPISTVLRRAGSMLWLGATLPAKSDEATVDA
ncbi:hypothetical protein [Methylopila sp. M107]|uniref:hypothetical protein n=1 Tax=Methylopila sp. M107 TaxID=1101190 RepID=UPI00037D0C1D|nr:hypothetical protein [Methylopila sp. M107]